MKTIAVRLKPDQDLRQSLKALAIAHDLRAGFVLSAIGSLKRAAIRFADQPASRVLEGKFELVALNGTLSVHGLHLHMAIADSTGQMLGGHLANGSVIYTTAEIIIGELPGLTFLRTPDQQTGFLELDIAID